MPDYIYLLKNRLSIHQQTALEHIRAAAREAGMTVFLVGGAVRDLTSGSPVFDLDVAVQGNALKLKKPLEKAGGKVWGEHEPSRTLFFRFPVGVTVEISSTRREEYPKPGKPVYHWDSILDDLRRRDFTANAMALSLNEHSYGLLMDPLNGVADIEARQLRLVSNYGFIEDPSRLLRATRLIARLGWQLDERTQTRFQNAREENAIAALSAYHRGYELEEIGHEEDGLRVLAAMEKEGWMPSLFPAWTTAAADAGALDEMRKLVTQLQMQGVSPDVSAVSVNYLTAKLAQKDLAELKALFVRQGFVEEWNNLDNTAKELNKQLTSKETALPSATWKLFTTADPQAVLWLGLTSRSPAIQTKYKNFFTVWPEARQKVPHALMQELRITPEIAGYDELMAGLFLGVIDGKLETEEQLRAFLEPYSPPAPPPPVSIRRTRGSKKSEAKVKAPVEAEADSDGEGDDPDLDDDSPHNPNEDSGDDNDDDDDAAEEEDHRVAIPPAPKKVTKPVAAKAAAPSAVVLEKAMPEAAKSEIKTVAKTAAKPVAVAPAQKAEAVAAPAPAAVKPAATKPVAGKPFAVPAPSVAPNPTAGKSAGGNKPAKVVPAVAKKTTPAKAIKATVGKPAPKHTAAKSAQAKPARQAPVKTSARPATRSAAKKPQKPAARSAKKPEPPKKLPAKKSSPAKKHR